MAISFEYIHEVLLSASFCVDLTVFHALIILLSTRELSIFKGFKFIFCYWAVINYAEQLRFTPNEYAKYIFEDTYIYNDSRMEELDVSIEVASEIVTDLRNSTTKNK